MTANHRLIQLNTLFYNKLCDHITDGRVVIGIMFRNIIIK